MTMKHKQQINWILSNFQCSSKLLNLNMQGYLEHILSNLLPPRQQFEAPMMCCKAVSVRLTCDSRVFEYITIFHSITITVSLIFDETVVNPFQNRQTTCMEKETGKMKGR